jgi:hypothetical protein
LCQFDFPLSQIYLHAQYQSGYDPVGYDPRRRSTPSWSFWGKGLAKLAPLSPGVSEEITDKV